jgi:hypothetical protein
MKVLFDAIKTKYDASATLVSACHGLHFGMVPQGTEMPYIVFYDNPGNPNYTFTEVEEERTIQFNILSDSSSSVEINGIYDKLIAAFDYCTLSVTGYNFIVMERTLNHLMPLPEENCWQYSVQYRIRIQKTR